MSVWQSLTDQLAVFVDRTTGEPKGAVGERFVVPVQPSRSEMGGLSILQWKRPLLLLWRLFTSHWQRKFVCLPLLGGLVKRTCIAGAFSAGVYLIVCAWILFFAVLMKEIKRASS
jgi:hypothetical protein